MNKHREIWAERMTLLDMFCLHKRYWLAQRERNGSGFRRPGFTTITAQMASRLLSPSGRQRIGCCFLSALGRKNVSDSWFNLHRWLFIYFFLKVCETKPRAVDNFIPEIYENTKSCVVTKKERDAVHWWHCSQDHWEKIMQHSWQDNKHSIMTRHTR